MTFQAFPYNALLLQKARKDANIAGCLGNELEDFTPDEIAHLSKMGYTFSKGTLMVAEDVKQLLKQHPDLLSRRIYSWDGWIVLHRLMFDDYSFITHESPKPIITALYGKDLIHPDCRGI